MPLLSVDDLVVRFRTREGTIHAVNGVSFELEPGERLGLVGESGCGKSVTNLAVIRLLPKPAGRIEGGRVVFEGQDMSKLSEAEVRDMRGKDIAMIFQDPMTSLNPVLRVEEQMVETIQAHRRIPREEARKRAIELLGMVGIPKPETRLRDYPHQFSGGMRQRVMIAMALALEPKLLIADEPTTALDVTIQAQVLELLQRLTTEEGTALILITHDLGVVAGMTQRIAVMYAGYIVEAATTADLVARPSHPYTVGLLHSVPRVDSRVGEELIPIEGRPPDMRVAPIGCPFAPRCAWRVAECWTSMPPLEPLVAGAKVLTTGAEATHRIACFDPPTPEEAAAGRPLREGFLAAPPPEGLLDELRGPRRESSVDMAQEMRDIYREEGPISPEPGAAGLPIEPDRRHHDGR